MILKHKLNDAVNDLCEISLNDPRLCCPCLLPPPRAVHQILPPKYLQESTIDELAPDVIADAKTLLRYARS